MSTILNKEELKALKKSLPSGYSKDIEVNVPCSRQTVVNVFKGDCKNLEIIDKVITEAIKLKNLKSKKEQAIAKKIQEAIA